MGTARPVEAQEDPDIITSSLEIEQIIKDLRKARSLVTVITGAVTGDSAGDTLNMNSMILDVDSNSGQFIYQASTENQLAAVTSSPKVYFHTTLRGALVRFSVTSASRTTFHEDPAIRSPLPTQLEYLQRRSHFRPPIYKSYTTTVKLPDGKPAIMDLIDISMGGVALSSTTITAETLPPGSVLDANLDFAELGKIDVTLKIISHRQVERQGRFTYTYGCAFHNAAGNNKTGNQQTKVQQLVFKLERLNKPWWHTH
ncbi:MAG: flagellar regulator YcgR PilZN domain-containing protein [Acidobacteriaceae bacterium]